MFKERFRDETDGGDINIEAVIGSLEEKRVD
jgi:hypothetical protein